VRFRTIICSIEKRSPDPLAEGNQSASGRLQPVRDLVSSLGATRVVDYTVEDFVDRAERYDLVVDAVGKDKSAAALRRCRRVLATRGACVSVDDGKPNLRREDLVLLGELAARGEIRPVIDRTYALDDIVDAHSYVDMGHERGNVIINVRLRSWRDPRGVVHPL
jgi:NADPH:quinone reductase-like Zn-dependent oxidoreductase